MNKKRLLTSILSIVVLTIAALTFIYFANDHKECGNTTTHTLGIVSQKHICKERFSF